MKRGGPLRRKTRLKPHSQKGLDYQEEYRRQSFVVLARARERCEILTPHDCSGVATPWPHHRKARSQGGTNDTINLLACCANAHPRWIHDQLPWEIAVVLQLIIPRDVPEYPYHPEGLQCPEHS
jgi:hypothetical protein